MALQYITSLPGSDELRDEAQFSSYATHDCERFRWKQEVVEGRVIVAPCPLTPRRLYATDIHTYIGARYRPVNRYIMLAVLPEDPSTTADHGKISANVVSLGPALLPLARYSQRLVWPSCGRRWRECGPRLRGGEALRDHGGRPGHHGVS